MTCILIFLIKKSLTTDKAIVPDIEKEGEPKEKKVAKVMGEFKSGKLKSSSGEVVTDKDQAIAIALSEAK